MYENKDVTVSIGRFRPYIKYNDAFVSLPKTEDPYTISIERCIEILKMPRLPKTIGTYEGASVVVSKGRFGPYIKINDLFVNIPRNEDPLTLELDRAIELIQEKRQAQQERIIRKFDEDENIQILKGRWGPYLLYKGKNIKLPKGTDPLTITYD